MLRHRTRGATVVGSLLILLLTAAAPAAAHHRPAHDKGPSIRNGGGHPSGKDRSVEPGGSGTQGKSHSTPDQDGRGPDRDEGGTDKPGGTGGADPTDQDGNNGCGNDTDFDDDNEGLCGGLHLGALRRTVPTQGTGQQVDDDSGGASAPAGEVLAAEESASDAEVLGVLFGAAGSGEGEATGGTGGGSELASTGLDATTLATVAMLLLVLGTGLVLLSRARRSAAAREN